MALSHWMQSPCLAVAEGVFATQVLQRARRTSLVAFLRRISSGVNWCRVLVGIFFLCHIWHRTDALWRGSGDKSRPLWRDRVFLCNVHMHLVHLLVLEAAFLTLGFGTACKDGPFLVSKFHTRLPGPRQ